MPESISLESSGLRYGSISLLFTYVRLHYETPDSN